MKKKMFLQRIYFQKNISRVLLNQKKEKVVLKEKKIDISSLNLNATIKIHPNHNSIFFSII